MECSGCPPRHRCDLCRRKAHATAIRKWRKKNKSKNAAYEKAYRQKNKKLLTQRALAYYYAHKSERSAYKTRYLQRRIQSDPLFAFQSRVRAIILTSLRSRRALKSGRARELLGCSVPALKVHLESKFAAGMSWQNWGVNGWHIDHIRPVSSFDLADPKQQRDCFHFTNLRKGKRFSAVVAMCDGVAGKPSQLSSVPSSRPQR